MIHNVSSIFLIIIVQTSYKFLEETKVYKSKLKTNYAPSILLELLLTKRSIIYYISNLDIPLCVFRYLLKISFFTENCHK